LETPTANATTTLSKTSNPQSATQQRYNAGGAHRASYLIRDLLCTGTGSFGRNAGRDADAERRWKHRFFSASQTEFPFFTLIVFFYFAFFRQALAQSSAKAKRSESKHGFDMIRGHKREQLLTHDE
jgi:hypothetical protein